MVKDKGRLVNSSLFFILGKLLRIKFGSFILNCRGILQPLKGGVIK